MPHKLDFGRLTVNTVAQSSSAAFELVGLLVALRHPRVVAL